MCFKTRIVIAEDFWFGSTTFGLAQGFRRLGWEVTEVSPKGAFIQSRSLAMRFLGRFIKPINVALYNKEILETVELMNASIFLTVKGNFIKTKTLETLASRGVKTVNYYPDFRFGYQSVDQKTFSMYSLFVTTKSFQVEILEKMIGKEKVRFLHHGYCSDVHVPPEKKLLDEHQVPDVLYVGTYTKHKEQLFTELKKLIPGLSFRIYGNGWDEANSNENLKSSLANHPVMAMNYAQLVNAAKINLAVHMGTADETGWQDLVSTRSFELPACKGFMLHVDNFEIRQLYKVGEEIDVFTSAIELSAKIHFYLKNDALRMQMIHKAYSRCVPAYSYDQRALQLASFLGYQ